MARTLLSPPIMRFNLSITGASLLVVFVATACGHADSPSPEGAPAPRAELSPLSYGEVFVRVTTTMLIDGQPAHQFGAKLTRPTASVDACAGALFTAGSCCYVSAISGGTTTPSTGFAGQTPDGGLTYTDESAGTLTLTSAASGAKLDALDYGRVVAGFGIGEGYPLAVLSPTLWNPGDVLRISAVGEAGHVSEFSASVHSVALPDVAKTSSIARSTALSFSWTPDANATSMTLTLASYPKGGGDSHGTIACKVDDSAGKLSVDPSLLAHFEVGDTCWGYLERAAVQNVEIAGGHVAVVSKGQDSFIVPVEP